MSVFMKTLYTLQIEAKRLKCNCKITFPSIERTQKSKRKQKIEALSRSVGLTTPPPLFPHLQGMVAVLIYQHLLVNHYSNIIYLFCIIAFTLKYTILSHFFVYVYMTEQIPIFLLFVQYFIFQFVKRPMNLIFTLQNKIHFYAETSTNLTQRLANEVFTTNRNK